MFKKLIIYPDFKLDDQPKYNNTQSQGQVKIKKIKKTQEWVDAGTRVKTQNFASLRVSAEYIDKNTISAEIPLH
jgi:hypothetical protein